MKLQLIPQQRGTLRCICFSSKNVNSDSFIQIAYKLASHRRQAYIYNYSRVDLLICWLLLKREKVKKIPKLHRDQTKKIYASTTPFTNRVPLLNWANVYFSQRILELEHIFRVKATADPIDIC